MGSNWSIQRSRVQQHKTTLTKLTTLDTTEHDSDPVLSYSVSHESQDPKYTCTGDTPCAVEDPVTLRSTLNQRSFAPRHSQPVSVSFKEDSGKKTNRFWKKGGSRKGSGFEVSARHSRETSHGKEGFKEVRMGEEPFENKELLEKTIAFKTFVEALVCQESISDVIQFYSMCLTLVFKFPLVLTFLYQPDNNELVAYTPLFPPSYVGGPFIKEIAITMCRSPGFPPSTVFSPIVFVAPIMQRGIVSRCPDPQMGNAPKDVGVSGGVSSVLHESIADNAAFYARQCTRKHTVRHYTRTGPCHSVGVESNVQMTNGCTYEMMVVQENRRLSEFLKAQLEASYYSHHASRTMCEAWTAGALGKDSRATGTQHKTGMSSRWKPQKSTKAKEPHMEKHGAARGRNMLEYTRCLEDFRALSSEERMSCILNFLQAHHTQPGRFEPRDDTASSKQVFDDKEKWLLATLFFNNYLDSIALRSSYTNVASRRGSLDSSPRRSSTSSSVKSRESSVYFGGMDHSGTHELLKNVSSKEAPVMHAKTRSILQRRVTPQHSVSIGDLLHFSSSLFKGGINRNLKRSSATMCGKMCTYSVRQVSGMDGNGRWIPDGLGGNHKSKRLRTPSKLSRESTRPFMHYKTSIATAYTPNDAGNGSAYTPRYSTQCTSPNSFFFSLFSPTAKGVRILPHGNKYNKKRYSWPPVRVSLEREWLDLMGPIPWRRRPSTKNQDGQQLLVLSRTLYHGVESTNKTPVGLLCVVAPLSNSIEDTDPNLLSTFLDYVAYQTQAWIHHIVRLDSLRVLNIRQASLLRFHRHAVKDTDDSRTAVRSLVCCIRETVNAEDVAVFIVDKASRKFVCCEGNSRCIGLRVDFSDRLLGPCLTSKCPQRFISRSMCYTLKSTQRWYDFYKQLSSRHDLRELLERPLIKLHDQMFSRSGMPSIPRDIGRTCGGSRCYPKSGAYFMGRHREGGGSLDASRMTHQQQRELYNLKRKKGASYLEEQDSSEWTRLVNLGSINVLYDMVAQSIVTRSVVCVPVLNDKQDVVLIIQVMNRLPEGYRAAPSFGVTDHRAGDCQRERVPTVLRRNSLQVSRSFYPKHADVRFVPTTYRHDLHHLKRSKESSIHNELVNCRGRVERNLSLSRDLQLTEKGDVLESVQNNKEARSLSVPVLPRQPKPEKTEVTEKLKSDTQVVWPASRNLPKIEKPRQATVFSYFESMEAKHRVVAFDTLGPETKQYTVAHDLDTNLAMRHPSVADDASGDLNHVLPFSRDDLLVVKNLTEEAYNVYNIKLEFPYIHVVVTPSQSSKCSIMYFGSIVNPATCNGVLHSMSKPSSQKSTDLIPRFPSCFEPIQHTRSFAHPTVSQPAYTRSYVPLGVPSVDCPLITPGGVGEYTDLGAREIPESPLLGSVYGPSSDIRVPLVSPQSCDAHCTTYDGDVQNLELQPRDTLALRQGSEATEQWNRRLHHQAQHSVLLGTSTRVNKDLSTPTGRYAHEGEPCSSINVYPKSVRVSKGISPCRAYDGCIDVNAALELLDREKYYSALYSYRYKRRSWYLHCCRRSRVRCVPLRSPYAKRTDFVIESQGAGCSVRRRLCLIMRYHGNASCLSHPRVVFSTRKRFSCKTRNIFILPPLNENQEPGTVDMKPYGKRVSNEKFCSKLLMLYKKYNKALSVVPLCNVVRQWGIRWWNYTCAEVIPFFTGSLETFALLDVVGKKGAKPLERFFHTIAGAYHGENPYHNFFHGIQVYHIVWLLLGQYKFSEYLTSVEILGTLLGALCHDVDHPGLNNDFLVTTSHASALVYNDVSVLENHHCSFCFRLLESCPECDFRIEMTVSDRQNFRYSFITGVLATDMRNHVAQLHTISSRVERHRSGTDPLASSKTDDRRMITEILLHAADISNPMIPSPYYQRWASLIVEEFNQQCDYEILLGLSPTPFMNCRTQKSRIDCQIEFLEFIVIPMWKTLTLLQPALLPVVRQGERNVRSWQRATRGLSKDSDSTLRQTLSFFDFSYKAFRHRHPRAVMQFSAF